MGGAVVSALALAAAPAAGRGDAGVADAGVAVQSPDASVALQLERQALRIALAERDAAEARLEVERLKKEVAEIRERTATVEKRVDRGDSKTDSHLSQQASQFDKLSQQIAEIKAQLNDENDRRQQTERKAADRKAQADLAVSALGAAEQTLASGSTDSVENALKIAEGAFTGQALNYVRSARQAFSNHDLAATRTYLAYAVAEAQAGRY